MRNSFRHCAKRLFAIALATFTLEVSADVVLNVGVSVDEPPDGYREGDTVNWTLTLETELTNDGHSHPMFGIAGVSVTLDESTAESLSKADRNSHRNDFLLGDYFLTQGTVNPLDASLLEKVELLVTLQGLEFVFPTGTPDDGKLTMATGSYTATVFGGHMLTTSTPNPADQGYFTSNVGFLGGVTVFDTSNNGIASFQVVVLEGDCNKDGSFTALDLACVRTISSRDVVLAALNTLPGDLDGDGNVAFADFLVLSANFAQDAASYADGNIDLEEGIGFSDFLILSNNFGKTPSGVAAVPEPNACLLVWLGLLGSVSFRRRRRILNQLSFPQVAANPHWLKYFGVAVHSLFEPSSAPFDIPIDARIRKVGLLAMYQSPGWQSEWS